jgi:hypothetical protein
MPSASGANAQRSMLLAQGSAILAQEFGTRVGIRTWASSRT